MAEGPFGLLRADDSRRPAFAAFQTATAYLGDFTTAREERHGDITAVTFERGAQTTTVLWVDGTSARSATVQAIAPQALLVDETGQTQTLLAQNGVYTLKLPGAACSSGPPCRIGGAPRLLVEEGAAAGRSALAAIPAPSPAAAARPAPAVQPQPQPSQDRPWRPARPGYLWMQ